MPREQPVPIDADRLIAEGRSLRALARSLLDDERADDVVHDSFVAALRQPSGVRETGPWLTRVVQRLAARWRRSDARRRSREQRVARSDVDAAADPARIAVETETLRAIAAAVHDLDEPFRTVVVLRFWHDASTRDIAARLGVPAETVRTRLHRGIERLRARLDARPGGRAAWTGALGAFVPGKKVAAVAAPAAAMLGATGMLMNAKLVIGSVAAATAAVLVVASTWPEVATHMASTLPEAHAVAAATTDPDAAVRDDDPLREAVASPGATSWKWPAVEREPLAPWRLRVRVLDDSGRPLDAASVLVWHTVPAGRSKDHQWVHEAAPFATVHTDALGGAEATLEDECVVVRADHAGGMSLEQFVYGRRAANEVLLRVERPALLRGTVVRPDGSRADGALVTAAAAGGGNNGLAPSASGEADTSGAFELRVPPRCTYSVWAMLNGERTFALVRQTFAGDPPPAVLTFPGAISVRGTVVDANGTPVAGARVRVWHADWRADRTDVENLYLLADDAGRFATDVQHHRRYGILASADGHAANEVLVVEPTPARPHVDVVVRLCPFATIAGTVSRADGTPIAGARVHASSGLSTAGSEPEPDRSDCFQAGVSVSTDDEGRFVLHVHPAIRWTVMAYPRREMPLLAVRRDDVAPGTTSCAFVLDDGDLCGCSLVARVTVPSGMATPSCAFTIDDVAPGVQRLPPMTQTASLDADRMRLPPIGIGRTIMVRIAPPEASGLAPLRIGPLQTVPGELVIDVPLQRFATVDVRVVFAGGRPAGPILVSAALPSGEWCAEPLLDVAHLTRCCAGDNTLTIAEEGKLIGPRRDPLWEQTISLAPGANPEVVVTVPAAKSPR